MQRKGWFKIPGEQDGERTLAEQLLGLDAMFAAVPGKVVLDLGCAEGLIAQKVADAGAAKVYGAEVIRGHVEEARKRTDPARVRIRQADLNDPATLAWVASLRADVVLMLAVLHKLHDPQAALEAIADATRELAVIRLPLGSDGAFASKHRKGARCDVNDTLPRFGFTFDCRLPGPGGEWVQYWRRV